MKKKKMLFIYNPKAGKERIKNYLIDIIDIFVKGKYEVTVFPTQEAGDGTRAVCQMQDHAYDLIACCGGDGTLDEVVTGVMKSECDVPIGFIPAGSTNDFASSLNIPKEMKEAAEVVTKGKPFACDVGTFNRDYFIYIAAFGIFTEVSYETKQDLKNMLGHMAYLLEGVKSLSNIKSYHMKITCEDRVIEDDFIYGMITNSISVGGFKNITGKSVGLNDGEFEVTLIRTPVNPVELNQTMTALVSRNLTSERMYSFKAKELTIECEEEVAYTLDGEYGGKNQKVTITNRQQAVRFLIK